MSKINALKRFLKPFLILLPILAGEDAVFAAADKGVVKITSTQNELQRTGTGFIIGYGIENFSVYILTVSHVVTGDTRPLVTFREDVFGQQPATVVKAEADNEKGLALLEVQFKERRPGTSLGLRTSGTLVPGTELSVIGMPRFAGDWTQVIGRVAGLRSGRIFLDAAIDEGNSGGPALLREQVVGVVSIAGGNFNRFAEIVPSEKIRDFVKPLIGIREKAFDRATVSFWTNHNSVLATALQGVWKYYHDGTLNLDRRKISIDKDNILRIGYVDTSYTGQHIDVELQGSELTFTFVMAGTRGTARLKVVNKDLMEGTYSDHRGTVPLRWQRDE